MNVNPPNILPRCRMPRIRSLWLIAFALTSIGAFGQNLTINDPQIVEGTGGTTTLVFAVSSDQLIFTSGGLSFEINTSDVTAIAGTDYTAISGGVGNIPFGSASTQVNVVVNPDGTAEPIETFNVVLSNPSQGAFTKDTGVGTIIDDDQAISISDANVTEGNAGQVNLTFTVSIDGGGSALEDISFTSSTSDGSAVSPGDYTATTQGGVILQGDTNVPVSVPVNGDAILEGNETFTITLSGVTNGSLGASPSATGTINNDDASTFSITDNSVLESAGPLPLTVTLSNAVQGGASVNYSFTDGTAIGGGTDYTGTPGTLNFVGNAGETQTINVPLNNDAIVENAESFTVTLASPTAGVTLADATATGTINDDDSVVVQFSTAASSDDEDTGGNLPVLLVLGTVTNTSSVTVTVTGGTAVGGGDDYDFTSPQVVNILAGVYDGTTGTAIAIPTLSIDSDNTAELDETIILGLSAPVGDVSLGATTSTTYTILNDDDQILAINSVSQAEGSGGGNTAFNFTVSIEGGGAAVQDIDFRVDTNNGSAVTPTDYAQLNNVQFTLLAGDTGVTVPIQVVADNTPEPDETFTVEISNASQGGAIGASNQGTGTIQNDDLQGLVISDVATTEGNSGTKDFVFTVSLAGGGNALGNITFNYATQDGTATTANADYVAATGSGSISAGSPSTTITVVVNGDAIPEFNETFSVVLSSPTGATLSDATGTGTIQNDDTNAISINDVTQVEGNSGTSSFIFTVSVDSGIALADIDFEANTTDGTATTANNDYVALSGFAGQIAQGGTSTSVAVTVNGDTDFEPNETFQVVLNNVQNASVTDGSGLGTIQNDDSCNAGAQAPELSTDAQTIFCTEDTIPSLNTFTNTPAPAGTELTWSQNPDPLVISAHRTDAQVAAPTAGTYYGFFFDSVNNCASPTLELTLVRNETPIIDSVAGDAICGPGQVTLTVAASFPSVATDPDVNWYDAETGGTLVFNGPVYQPNLTETTSFWVEATGNGCTTSPRVEVVAIVSPAVSSGTPLNGARCSDPAFGQTTVDLDERIEGETAGFWTIITDPSGSLTFDADNIVDFTGVPDGTYVFRFTTNTAEAPCVDESTDVSISVNNCDVDSDGDGLLDGVEAALETDPNNPDTDGDGIDDGTEVVDADNPADEDGDGIIDARDSNTADTDQDGVNDQQDPANTDACIPNPDNINCDTDLGVTKTANRTQVSLGQEVVFTITLDNFSTVEMTAIEVGDLLQAGFEFVSATASVGAYNDATGVWTVPAIAANASETLEITVTAVEGDSYSNTAELLTSSPVDGNPDNDSSSVTLELVLPADADLAIEKFAQITPGGTFSSERIAPLVNDRIRFLVSVTNNSPDAVVSDIQVLDALNPETTTGFEYVQHTYTQGTFPAGAYDPATGIWNIATLNPGETVELSIVAYVRRQGTFTNTAELLSPASDADVSNNSASVEVDVAARNEGDPIFNQFSPNGDGINDQLKIQLFRFNPETGSQEQVIQAYSIQIFNRYGQLIFDGNNLTSEVIWDGNYNGTQAPEGTYFYVLLYAENGDAGVAETVKKGWIQLIR